MHDWAIKSLHELGRLVFLKDKREEQNGNNTDKREKRHEYPFKWPYLVAYI